MWGRQPRGDMTKEQDKKRIEGILEERAGYLRSGKKEKLAAVDEELKRLGYEFPEVPKGRSSAESRQHKADEKGKESA